MRGEAVEAVLVRQLLQLGAQLPVGHLDLVELQLALPQLDTTRRRQNLGPNSAKYTWSSCKVLMAESNI